MSNVGIYKIQSPSGRVYIGQSINMCARKSKYRRIQCHGQRYLFSSLSKYGFESHTFEIIHPLPKDTTQEVLNAYECLYMDLYKSCGIKLLNIRHGGHNGKQSPESIEKSRIANTGRKASAETKIKMSISGKGRRMSEDTKRKIISTKKEKGNLIADGFLERGKPFRFTKGLQVWNKGKSGVYSAEHIEKMKQRRASEETKEKIREARKRQVIPKGRTHSEESKEKMRISAIKRGNNLPKGFTHSAETREKIRIANSGKVSPNKGKIYSEKVRAKIAKRLSGNINAHRKKVLCTKTNKIFNSIGEASKFVGIKRTTLNMQLLGINKNKTSLIYYNG